MSKLKKRVRILELQVQALRTAIALGQASGQPSITWMDTTFARIEEEAKEPDSSIHVNEEDIILTQVIPASTLTWQCYSCHHRHLKRTGVCTHTYYTPSNQAASCPCLVRERVLRD